MQAFASQSRMGRDCCAPLYGRHADTRAAAAAASFCARRQRMVVRMDAAAAKAQMEVVRFGQDLGLPNIEIKAGGCLGNCGNGPNLVVLPEGLVLRHVSTPANLAQALSAFCGADVSDEVLHATELRLAGNNLAMEGDFPGAIAKYNEALQLSSSHRSAGAYMVHSNLSAAHLQLGQKPEALKHAQAAVEGAPRGFHKAHIRLIDAYYSLGMFSEAEAALAAAVALDPTFTGLQEYKIIIQALKNAKKSVST